MWLALAIDLLDHALEVRLDDRQVGHRIPAGNCADQVCDPRLLRIEPERDPAVLTSNLLGTGRLDHVELARKMDDQHPVRRVLRLEL